MDTCIIDVVSLEPYSSEKLYVICGYDYDEVVEWFKNQTSTTSEKNISKIKDHFKWYKEHLVFFKDYKKDINNLLVKNHTTKGMYISKKLKVYPGCKIRMILLKKGWSSSTSDNMITLAHETLHLCQEFLPELLNRDVEHEAEAYFHSYIMNTIVKYFD